MDFHGFKWLISFCACSFQISIIMFIFLYRLTGGDDHADQGGKACLKCFCDTFDSDRCMNSLTRRWMSICSRSMVKPMLFSFGYDYYSSARMVAPQLNHQIILLLKRPLTHYWTSPLIKSMNWCTTLLGLTWSMMKRSRPSLVMMKPRLNCPKISILANISLLWRKKHQNNRGLSEYIQISCILC